MDIKNLQKHSIVSRIFFLLMIVILLQAFLSLNTILLTNVATKVETYSYNIFTRTVSNRKNNLESFMSASWSNISEVSVAVSGEYDALLGNNGTLTEKEKVEFLSNSVDSVVQMMIMTGTTGGFIILDDGEDMTYSYSSVYLKSYDNLSQVVSRENLMLARGPAEISKENGFSLVSNWSYGMALTEETIPILKTPMKEAEVIKNLEYLGYWYISTDITNENLKVLTCSMPILDKNQNPIGVVGVEVSQEYLYKFLPSHEFGGDWGSYGYVLADVQGDSFTPVILNGTIQSNLVPIGEKVSLDKVPINDEDLESIPKMFYTENEHICVYFEPLDLYVNHSPFQNDVLWLVGMVDLDNITTFTREFWDAIWSMLSICLATGLVISYIVGRMVAQPILELSKVVSTYDVQEKITFKRTNIREIDELSSVIEELQENILRSANRTEKILDLLNKGVGSFEFVQGSDVVAVSEAVYKMLDLQEYHGKQIPKDLFFLKLETLKSNPVEDVSHTYQLGTENVLYYKVEEFSQDNILLGVIEDTTKEVEDLLVLNYERNYDVLTGIFNRRAFHHKVMEVMKFYDLKVAGFVMFDLDNLKYVNDTFGHDSGDVYIKTAATTLYTCLHKYGVVGRMSGDEFYAFLYGFDDKESLMATLHGLYAQFEAEPIEMPNASPFKIRISGGIAWYGDDSTDLEELKKFADFAMYKGKHTLKGEMRQFDKENYLEESFMLSGKEELNRILDNELINFVFQPIIHVKTGEIHGYEALMRPISDSLSTPTKLLQLASMEGKLWRVEKIALFKTISLYKKYQKMFNNVKLFINSIPSENLKDEEYDQLNSLYSDCLPNVVVEITEQEQVTDGFIHAKLEKLHLLHMDIALDDYGSGYANDIGLIKMKPDIVKIDRSLISNVHVDPSRQAIVHKIIGFCKEHHICVLGEGIETEQEFEYMIQAGIELAQGFYISRPMEFPNFNTKEIMEKISEFEEKHHL